MSFPSDSPFYEEHEYEPPEFEIPEVSKTSSERTTSVNEIHDLLDAVGNIEYALENKRIDEAVAQLDVLEGQLRGML